MLSDIAVSAEVEFQKDVDYIAVVMQTGTSYRYIVKKEGSKEPMIEGTRITVRDIVEEWRLGASPEEIPTHYPHITLAQVFEALAYYQDHKGEIEAFIEKNKVRGNLDDKTLSR